MYEQLPREIKNIIIQKLRFHANQMVEEMVETQIEYNELIETLWDLDECKDLMQYYYYYNK